ncbi:MATE family efflux transporter [Alkaliphilus hydrothermalis]|uniref:Probable multidrug resistance protein NorM n=1 Tax=Alkaliphilus hydrothermalis TaxID=1482730 RepID=A0ABS2NPL5_9FIRM|nr:MATE family efflux transporter [Alkaliphilus hydrothermalis]MBM7614878.1 putative MATE family efflux protein [Alkaliphilus hydrothermalis]
MGTAAAILDIKESDKKVLRRNVINIAWPAVTELILISLVGAIDMIMVGKLGAAAIASIGLTNQPIFLIMAIFQALNVGGTAIVSREIGAGNVGEANKATRHVIIITSILSVLIIIPAMIYVTQIYKFMGADQDVIDIGLNYFKVALIGIIFQNISLAVAAVLRGSGDTKSPMMINVGANIINVIMNYLLIFGMFGAPQLGVTGAGVATLLARMLGMIFLIGILASGRTVLRLRFKNFFSWDQSMMKKVIKIGLPSAAEQLVLRTGNLTFVRIIAGLGTVIYASHQIAISILSLSFTTGMAFAMAASALIGQSLGAEKRELAEAYGKEVRFLGSVVATTIGVLFFIFSEQIIGLYSSDPAVIKNASIALRMIAIIQPFQSSQLILAGGLRGAGDTKWPLLSTMAGIWGIRVTLGILFVLVFKMGLFGAWLAICVDQVIRYCILYMRFRTGKWKYVKI